MSDKFGIVNKPPYFDDFDPSKNYSKILFRPGRAIQSRELTQIQSILQHQIAAIGDKVISSPIVSGGDFQVGLSKFLKFYSTEDVSYLKGKLGQIVSGQKTCKFKILEVLALTDDFSNAIESYDGGGYITNNYAVFFDYTNGYELTDVTALTSVPQYNQSVVATIIDEVEAEQTSYTFDVRGIGSSAYEVLAPEFTNTTTGYTVYGSSLLARLGSGIFYKNGYFIVSDEPLLLTLSTETTTNGGSIFANFAPSLQNAKIAINLTPQYVTTEEDPTLFDPSAGFYNYAAPGADRFRISTELINATTETDDGLIVLSDIVDGQVRISSTITNSSSKCCAGENCVDQILKPFTFDIIGNTLSVGDGRAVVNCTDITIIEPRVVTIAPSATAKKLFNQPLNHQCLADAVIVQNNITTALFGGVAGNDYSLINTNYYGSGKIRKLFSDEAPRLEIMNGDGLQIGCLTLLDITENDSTSSRLYYNELTSYVSTISESNLFAEASTLALNGEVVFTIESSVPLTCGDTAQGSNKRLVYKLPRGTNIKNVFDTDYMITRDFIGNISTKNVPMGSGNGVGNVSATVVEFDMDIPNGVFNDANVGDGPILANPDLFTLVVNGKALPLKNNTDAPYMLVNSKTKVTAVLKRSGTDSGDSPTTADGETITVPTAGTCYLIAKVRFPEKASVTASAGISDDPIPHRRKILKEARGSFVQNLATNPTISLGFSDVYKLTSIKDYNGTDVTSKFVFDDGQRNDRYDHGSVTLDTNESPENSEKEYVIEFQYFEHTPISPGFYGPITVNSYGFDKNGAAIPAFHGIGLNGTQLTFGYDQIPNFLDRSNGEVLSLGDCIDYRMVRTEEGLIESGVNVSSIVRGRWFPAPDSSAAVEASYSINLPRIDLLVLGEDGNISLIAGEASSNPIAKEYPKDGVVVAEINVPGTILSSQDFIIKNPPIKSVSLPELNDMQNRIAELEKALSIKTLENKAKIQSAALNNEFLTGMIVDDFGGHYVGDVSNDEYNCSMDFSRGTLRVPFTTQFFDFVPSSGYPTSGTTAYYLLANAYTNGVTLINNTQGTDEISINGFGLADWHGYMTIDRPNQMWLDQTTKPVVKNNNRGQNDAWDAGGESVQPNGRNKGFGTQWAYWKSLWFGDTLFEKSNASEKDRASAKNFDDLVTNIAPSRFVRNTNKETLLGSYKRTISGGGFSIIDHKSNRFTDSSLDFFVPSDYIILRAYSLKPNTTFSVYFDNTVTPVASSRLFKMDKTALTSVVTNSSGYVEFILSIPAGAYISGNKIVKLLENTSSSKPSFATAMYHNIGSDWKNKTSDTNDSLETEMLLTGRSDIIIKNEKTAYPATSTVNGVYQTFFVDKSEYPKGLILDKATVYLSVIDTTVPISVEIRKINREKYDPNYIVKNSRVEVLPSAAGNIDFVFANPVYITAGEYALFVKTNSNKYKAHISQRGITRIDSEVGSEVIAANSVYGTTNFFNGSVIAQEGDSSTTLRFTLMRKSFVANAPSTPKVVKAKLPLIGGVASEAAMDLLYFANDNWQNTSGGVSYTLKTNESEDRVLPVNTDFDGSDTFKTAKSTMQIDVTTDREDISPIVDIRKLGLLTIKNRISTNIEVDEETETANFGGLAGSQMKYITRRTDLDLPANIIKANIEAKLPAEFDVRFYAKVLYEGEGDFDSKVYKPMTKVTGSLISSKEQFRELIFELDETDIDRHFVSFSIKCIVLSNITNPSTQTVSAYPELRNMTITTSVR